MTNKICNVILVTCFDDLIVMTSLKWSPNWFFKSSISS